MHQDRFWFRLRHARGKGIKTDCILRVASQAFAEKDSTQLTKSFRMTVGYYDTHGVFL